MPPLTVTQKMTSHLSTRRTTSSLRALTTVPPGSHDFSSNDFLSLSTSATLRRLFLAELTSTTSPFRLGSGGSRLLDGNSPYAETLEKEIASFHKAEEALLFNSGYDANSGFFATVPQKGDVVIYDEKIHASVHEGMRLSRAGKCIPFAHSSVSSLSQIISEFVQTDESIKDGGKNIFVAVESLYSMDGDLAPLEEIVETVERLLPGGNGYVIVDEAHSNGVFGERGRGVVCELGLEGRVFARLHTFGKGVGCNGAAILCSKVTREYLINYAKPLIYSTSLSFPSLAAIKVVYSLMKQGATEPLIAHLKSLTTHFHSTLTTLLTHSRSHSHSQEQEPLITLPPTPPASPIFALLTPHPRSLAKYCQEGGFMVRAIVPPTVPEGTQRVRVCLHAGNSFEDVEGLVGRIGGWLEMRMGVRESSEEKGMERAREREWGGVGARVEEGEMRMELKARL